MEIKEKQKTLAGLFLRFAVLFCANTFIIIAGVVLLMTVAVFAGLLLPADYAETGLTEYAAEIQSAGNEPEEWIPQGCTYGIYDPEGNWVTGNFPGEEQEYAWKQYQNDSIYAAVRNYYRYIRQDNGNTCIVKYRLYMRYAWDRLNEILPAPEPMSIILAGILFIINAIILSKHFARRLNRQLEELRAITEKIAENDLEFQTSSSDIRELDAVMKSLAHMKDALKDSLTAQWNMEQQKQQQLASLTHDIKTPLTIIKGNAELLAESSLSDENKECTEYILANTRDIQRYLERMKDVLYGTASEYEETVLSGRQLKKMLWDSAVEVGTAGKIPVTLRQDNAEIAWCGNCKIYCCQEGMIRAWKNILSNAAEYTDQKKGLSLSFRLRVEKEQKYLEAAVRDYGPGFSPEDLGHAEEEFYSGDRSRHSRGHQGLGMAIARKFLEEQGGRLEYGNHKDKGAEVRCLIRVGERKIETTETKISAI